MLKATLKKLNMSGMGWSMSFMWEDALMDYLILSPSWRQTICHKMAEASPPHPTRLFSQVTLTPNFLVKGELTFLLLEFERADNGTEVMLLGL